MLHGLGRKSLVLWAWALAAPALARPSPALDTYPVTNAQFLEFVSEHPRWSRGKVSSLFAEETYLSHWQEAALLGARAPANSPVVFVSWFAAKAYCEWKGRSLPKTEVWEEAAAAGNYEGPGIRDPKQVILDWYGRPTPKVLSPVGSTQANKDGIYDLHGLIWEWTEDFNSVLSPEDTRDGAEGKRGLFCGAGALAGIDPADYAAYMRAAFRASIRGVTTLGSLGFRCAK